MRRTLAVTCWAASAAFTRAMSSGTTKRTLRGVVFDMDGTLTIPNLDFSLMYQRCGVSRDQDILEVLAALPAEEAAEKFAIIESMEEEARETLTLMPGAAEVLDWLKAHRIRTGMVTRNTQKTADFLLKNLLGGQQFDIIIARDTNLPHKPNPAALHHILKEWAVEEPSDVVMVGDSVSNDVAFGRAAGAKTVLLDTRGRFENAADIVVRCLHHLPQQVCQRFEIAGKLGTNVPLLKYDDPLPTSRSARAAFENNVAGIVEPTTADKSGNTPLIWAADAGNVESVRHLLSIVDRANVNTRGYLGATAVCRAARRGNVEVLDMLLQAGADADIPNDKIQYPLHFAAFKQHMPAVEVLLKYGANTRVLDRKGRTPAQDTSDTAIRDRILAATRDCDPCPK